MANQVVSGAALKCSFGSTPAAFTGSSQRVSARTAAGVVADVGSGNVRPFGLCSSPTNPAVSAANGMPQPCVPALSPWTPGSGRVTIGGIAALDDASQCKCAWAGVVTVSSPGQPDVTD